MAINAIVFHLWSACEIPVAIHAAVCAVSKRGRLRAVALRTKIHHIFISQIAAIGRERNVSSSPFGLWQP